MTFRWTDQQAIDLIGLYKSYPLLWDSSHKMYKNAVARTHAYDRILQKLMESMDNSNITVQDIRCKIKNLRSSYYQEMKKMARANREGTTHKCTLIWFDYFKDIMSTIAHKSTFKRKSTGEQRSDSEDSLDAVYEKIEKPVSLNVTGSYVVSIKQEYLDELAKEGTKIIEVPDDYFDTITVPFPKRIKMEKQHDTFEEEAQAEDEKTLDNEEFQIFANNVAQQLRSMPLDKALRVQVDIQALVAKERIDLYNEKDENKEV